MIVEFFPEEKPWEGVLMIVGISLLIVGYILSWIKEGLGGAIMILAGLTVSLPLIILDTEYGLLTFGIPTLVAGLLFLIYWRDMRRKKL